MASKQAKGMTSKIVYSDYEVVVEVKEGWLMPKEPALWHQAKVRDLQDVANSIKRHVDDIDGAVVRFTTTVVCPHCEEPIDGGYVDGEPACCTEAQEEYVALGYELS